MEPEDVAKQRMERARSDAGWDPYAHSAFEQAHRAVSEL